MPHLRPTASFIKSLRTRKSSPTLRSFNSENLLPVPNPPLQSHPVSQSADAWVRRPLTPRQEPLSPKSASPESIFDEAEGTVGSRTDEGRSSSPGNPIDDPASFDLKAPPPNASNTSVEWLADRLFSEDHLKVILTDHALFLKFAAFLNKYKPHSAPVLIRYLETEKAIKAVEYANAIADSLPALPGEPTEGIFGAAMIDQRFQGRSRRALDELVTDALPAFITESLVQVVTECLVKKITGTIAPVMRELVVGLSEVFCLTDPSLPDNPIVYASDGTINSSSSRSTDVTTSSAGTAASSKDQNLPTTVFPGSVKQYVKARRSVNRRDGSPFLNLVMSAPLFDDRGSVRYFIGAQIEVTGLIEGGRGLESLEKLLTYDRKLSVIRESRRGSSGAKKRALQALSDLSQMFSLEEAETARRGSRGSESPTQMSGRGSASRRLADEALDDRQSVYAAPTPGLSGRLPGVYQNYLLVRPFPSLRITFVSPALRIPGLLQSRFLEKIGGSQNVRDGIAEAFAQSEMLTAKINWLPRGNERGHPEDDGRPRYIQCTPLLGSDGRVGVWMVVMVENDGFMGVLKDKRGMRDYTGQDTMRRTNAANLYAEYLRNQGRSGGGSSSHGSANGSFRGL
ncbi:MAG: hypothetical protein M1819_000188 [Sarea resinae]|nr:MAG: hypothetical protein M1819_000188 [Sarea resinae]